MFKKMLVASALLAATSGIAMASVSPYVGGSLGVNVNSSTSSVNGNAGVFRGVPVKAFLGFGGAINEDFFLAGEATATLGTFEMSNRNKMKTSYGYALSILPGLMMNDSTVAFARAGFTRIRFTNVNKMSSGALVGLGMQTSFTQHIDIRGEYDYTSFNEIGGINTPRTDEYTLGMVYKFD